MLKIKTHPKISRYMVSTLMPRYITAHDVFNPTYISEEVGHFMLPYIHSPLPIYYLVHWIVGKI